MQWLVLIVSLLLQLVTVDFYISMWQRFFFLALDVFRKEFQQKKKNRSSAKLCVCCASAAFLL